MVDADVRGTASLFTTWQLKNNVLAPSSTFFLVLKVSILCAVIIGCSGVFSMKRLDARTRQKSVMIIILYFEDSEQKESHC